MTLGVETGVIGAASQWAGRGEDQLLPWSLWREHHPADLDCGQVQVDFGPPTSITVKGYISAVLSHPLYACVLSHFSRV